MADQEGEREREIRSIVATVMTLGEISETLTSSAAHFSRAAVSFASDVATLKAMIGMTPPGSDAQQ